MTTGRGKEPPKLYRQPPPSGRLFGREPKKPGRKGKATNGGTHANGSSGPIGQWLTKGTRLTDGRIVLGRKEPVQTARFLLRNLYTATNGELLLHHHRDQFYVWDVASYRDATDRKIRAKAQPFLERDLSGPWRAAVPVRSVPIARR